MTRKGISGILVTVILFTGLVGTTTVPVVTESFDTSLSTPDLSIEGILLPYWTPYIYLIDQAPDPEWFYRINATVANLGTSDAGSFNVSFSVHLNETEVPEYTRKKTIFGLVQGMNKTVWFDLYPEDYSNYTLVIEADCDNDVVESDETNNVETIWLVVTIHGDLQGDTSGTPPDGDVDKFDFGQFAYLYGRVWSSEPPYCPADFNYDGAVDKYDFGIFAYTYGQSV